MNRNQYRGKNGRFERCTVEKLFGIKVNEKANTYRCNVCGRIFVPILESGKCECGSAEKTLVKGANDDTQRTV